MKFYKNIINILIILLMLFYLLIPTSYGFSDFPVWNSNISSTFIETSATPSVSLELESESAILIEQNSGQILYEHNIHEQLRPASVTKIMSILLIMEQIDSGKLLYTDKITCSENATSMGGSQIWLDSTEQLTVDEMLKAICVVSANDCVVALAEHIAGTQSAFVNMMNAKAKELGMNDTVFKNCHGLDEDGHLTSSYDIALMSRELLTKHPDIIKYTTIYMDSLRDGKSQLVNTNKLIRTYNGITGLKTGSTSLALYNLSASATRDNLSLIAVIMKAPSTKVRFAEAKLLLDYGFNNYSYYKFGNKNDVVKNISVSKGTVDNVDVVIDSDCGTLLAKGTEKEVVQNINLPNNISAPIEKGQIIGTITYSLNDDVIGRANIVSSSDIDKLNIFTIFKKVFNTWINLSA